jgi:hypothetical protein
MKERATEETSVVKLPPTLAIGFAGDRALRDEEKSRYLLLEFLRQRMASADGMLYGVSSLAAGADLLFVEACIELGISLQILLPMPAEELSKILGPAAWLRAQRALNQALSVEVVGSQDSAEESYYECGIETIQRSGLLLAIWDGKSSSGADSTDQIVRFAEKIDRPVIWIHSENGSMQTLNPAAERRLLHDPELEFLNDLPGCGASWPGDSPTAIATQWFKKIDANASRLAPQVRRLASIPILYTAVAAVLSGAASKSSASAAWIAASAGLGVTAAALPIVLRLDRRQALWARTRTAAEVSRSVLALWDAPCQCVVIGPEIGSELVGTLTSLRFLKMKAASHRNVTVEEFRECYRKDRLLEQIHYYSTHALQAEGEAKRYRRITYFSVAVAVLLAACWLAGAMGVAELHTIFQGHWFGLALSALFQAATIVAALEIVNDSSRRQRRYGEIHDWLKGWDQQLEALRTWPSVLKVVIQVEKALMVELLEWRSLARNTKLPRK